MTRSKIRLVSFTTGIIIAIFAVTPLTPTTTPFALAQEQATIGQTLDPGDLAIDATPENFVFQHVEIRKPTTYFRYYINPALDPDTTAIKIHDGRFNGGFQLTIQSSNYEKIGDPTKTIPNSFLTIVTSGTDVNEITVPGTPVAQAPLDGDPNQGSTDYEGNSLDIPQVILEGTSNAAQGRVGTYYTFPSFRLEIPLDTTPGRYTNTVTYTLTDSTI